MKVAILGGWDTETTRNIDWKVKADEKSQRQIIQACQAIGKRLARHHHTVIVGSEQKNSADYHVVHSMLEEMGKPGGSLSHIQVIEGVEKDEPLYQAEREDRYGRYFSSNPTSFGRPIRSAEKILAVQDADAVITIGGLTDTWTGGIAAIVARKVIMPIGTFGGASLQLLQAMKTLEHALKSPENTPKLNQLENQVWHPDLLDTVFDLGALEGDRVFFGYCGKAKSTAAAIIQYMKSLGFQVWDWADDNRTGESILKEIQAKIASSKYGLFLFTPDDPLVSADGKKGVPRDNVVFEAGYFMGVHGPQRTKIIAHKDAKVPSDYGGHIYISLEDASDISPIRERLRKAFDLAPST